MALTYDIDTCSIYINDSIEVEMLQSINEFKVKYLKKAETLIKKPDINIYINTGGGCAYTCFGIVDVIESLCEIAKVTTHANGLVMSAGVPIWLSGTIRKATERTRFMIHQVSAGAWGTVNEIKDELEEMEYLNDVYIDIIVANTTISRGTLKSYSDVKKDFYLNAKEMLSYLILTEEESKEIKNARNKR